MIMVDYNRGRLVSENSKTDYVILEQPLNFILILGLVVRLEPSWTHPHCFLVLTVVIFVKEIGS